MSTPKPDTHCHDEDTGRDVWSHSPEQVREYSAQVAAAENYGLLSLLYDIRKAAGDKDGKLMQDELVARIAGLRVDAERYRHYRDNSTTLLCVRADKWCGLHNVRMLDAELDAVTDAAIDAARAAHVEQEQG
jgi:hypothetical protein